MIGPTINKNVEAMAFMTDWLWRTRPADAIGARMEWLGRRFDAPDGRGIVTHNFGHEITGCCVHYGVYSEIGNRRGTETVFLQDLGFGMPAAAATVVNGPAPAEDVESLAERAAEATKPMSAYQEMMAKQPKTEIPFA